ncbi:minor tail protein [Mycobacterium phage Gaia]|uniref:Minor tail protein n=1 Tax=Mycobacterium phage Gaia TaxID=1486472 RepID=A0A068F4H6_9CAUD|nr:minor tail protein [Mycobacterium phage Gaia]AID58841.1 minor tail protein [Mycobacterium phage Gaia]
MPRAFDRHTPIADYDPTNVLEFDASSFVAQLGDVWKLIWATLTEGIDNSFKALLRALLGGFPDDIEISFDDLIAQLAAWVSNIDDILGHVPLIGDLIEAITGREDGDLNDLGTWFLNLRNFLANINFGDPNFNLLDAAAQFVSLLLAPLRNVLPQLLTFLPIGAITNRTPNLLAAPKFSAGSIDSGSEWVIDPSKSHSSDGTGAVRVLANSKLHALRSNVIGVGGGQKVDVSIYVTYQGYEGSGAPIRLEVVPYINDVEQAPVPVAAHTPQSQNAGWTLLSGRYTVPEGVTSMQLRLVVDTSATEGTVWFDDAEVKQTGTILQEWVDGLPDVLQTLLTRVQVTIDTVVNALRGGIETTLNTFEDLFDALKNINPANIIGMLGPGNLIETIEGIVNNIVGGLVGVVGGGAGLADLFNILREISSRASRGDFAWIIQGIRTNKPAAGGLGPSERSNMNLSEITGWVSATQSSSLIAWDYIEESMPIGAISWMGKGVSGITEFYVHVWKMDTSTGVPERIHSSENILSVIADAGSADPDAGAYLQYELPQEEVIPAEASDLLGYEFVPVGGTHEIRGRVDSFPLHPTAPISKRASTRDNTTNPSNPPLTIPRNNIVWSDNVPWVGIAVDTGVLGDQHDPEKIYLGTTTTTIPVARWVNYIDPVALGAGGGGHQGIALGINGSPGQPGQFNATTWVRGEDFDDNAVITFTPGTGGTGGMGGGAPGGDTVITIETPDGPTRSITATGGAAGTSTGFLSSPVGRGPSEFTFNEQEYVGGGDQKVMGGKGTSPGGGGNGGRGSLAAFQPGGNGGPGGGWLYLRPDALPDPDPDLTPPTAPTSVELVESTFSSLTITWSGATDE